ncbi:phage N-6-adenine-methyltransferase [Xenorhabdus griffiniae]|uniref:Phage N-6-adenine-methyltransferase n=1 Tax=Xenorhabdus griffiniae TaxID=351672 RepID=A0ABY9XED0_9GAMM|nr:phage N-6-adenine-methyltransferase [Xenorhabdus griffiniae]MBD1228959.1 phage N-6-adenine-methyltransferase [Xenorhabdus griffiniae]MBE8588596.1 phage N-6-adenine-methyltransferase [Xenorhabdus griffiniae]WMV71279.1 phage N-6-adenine-methyltransferase [Xenorhabdus griffiniae]WNH00955.1 phage N-6-adenine-methyltransferase [Xenorhabdus griffiniae]
MSDFGGSNTPPELKDLWQTPLPLFMALDIEFGFYLDAAADAQNTLCAHYLTERDNALECDWASYGAIWCNPPYSNIKPWIEKAAIECQKQLQPIVMLIPADLSVGWFKLALETVDEVRLITGGRISFINAETKKSVNGNNKGSLLLIWRPFTAPRRIITTVERDYLMIIGNHQLEKIA